MGQIGFLEPRASVLSRRREIVADLVDLLSLAVALPETTQQVAAVLKYCHRYGVPVVPRGAGTSLAGGAIPQEDAVVVGLSKMAQILEVDYANRTATVQAGVTNLSISDAVSADGYFYAPDPSSQLACTIGGNIGMNSGGAHCLKYGVTTNNLLGVKLVLIDGTIVELGGKALDAGGLDLLGVVCGGEGQLGIVTEATVRLRGRCDCGRHYSRCHRDLRGLRPSGGRHAPLAGRDPRRRRSTGAEAGDQRSADPAFDAARRRGRGAGGRGLQRLGRASYGREAQALEATRRNVDVWLGEIKKGGLDAIIITASGCGATIKDYGFMLRLGLGYADKAARVSVIAKDVTEYLATLDLRQQEAKGLTVVCHSACSMQHGQKITMVPKTLLKAVGFVVRDPAEGHLCCGSAGTYNILQPEISGKLSHQEQMGRKLRTTYGRFSNVFSVSSKLS